MDNLILNSNDTLSLNLVQIRCQQLFNDAVQDALNSSLYEAPGEILGKLRSIEDFTEVMKAVISADNLTDEEVKNSPSSSD